MRSVDLSRLDSEGLRLYRRLRAQLKSADRHQIARVANRIEKMDREKKLLAIYIVRLASFRGLGLRMVPWLEDSDEAVRWEVASALSFGGKRITRSIIRGFERQFFQAGREQAAYALAFSQEPLAIPTLMELFTNERESPQVRSQAAEGLGMGFQFASPRNKKRSKAIGALASGLRDPNASVRFWSAFALGTLKAKEAIPELQRIVKHDKKRVKGWWSVAREARDALERIENV